jgi:DNA-binding MarR family transcriptional regulator
VSTRRADPKLDLSDDEYRELLAFRTAMRRFLRWSETQATALGITPAQHQLLLAIRGHDRRDEEGTARADGDPTIGDIAESLLLRHHSAVGLVDRAVTAGLVERHADSEDQRMVRLRLTALGSRRLRQLAGLHLAELRRMMPAMGPALFAEQTERSRTETRGAT